MKYIDAEKLIAELRRQKHELELSIQSQGDYGQSCHIVAYENIISLIDSLQQEQPEVDLEKEFKEYVDDDPVYSKLVNHFAGISIARHFYELGRFNARKEE